MSLNERFLEAATKVKNLSKRPPDSEILEVYGLYKQATIGDTNICKPADAKAKNKFEAWMSKKGMPVNEAKEKYILKAQNLVSKYA